MSTDAAAPRLRPLRVGEVLDVAIKIYRHHFATLVRVVLVIVVPTQVLSAIVRISTIQDPRLAGQSSFSGTGGTLHQDTGIYLAGGAIILVLGLISGPLTNGAGMKAVADGYLGGHSDWRDSLRFAFKRLLPLMWLAVLTGVLLTLATICLIVPGVYFFFAWSVAVPVLMVENQRGFGALSRSAKLVKGRWWPTAGALVLSYVFISIVGAVVGGLLTAVALSGNTSVATASIVVAIASIVSTTLTKPFQVAVTAVIYFDLRVRKEGFDLQLLAEALGAPPGDSTFAQSPAQRPPGTAAGGSAPPYWPPPPGWTPDEPSPPPPPPPPPSD
jgi:glycerophosphoryl diester phosphodiesterase family protein